MIELTSMMDIKKMTDEELVGYVRDKDQEAYYEIMNRYQDKLLRYALSLTHQTEDAADIVQNSFLKAFISLNGFNVKLKFSSWLYRIVHNEAVNLLLKNKKELPLNLEVDIADEKDFVEDFSLAQERALLKECLADLPLIYAEPLALYFLEEKSYEEIAYILRCRPSTIGTRLRRAKILIKKICQKRMSHK